MIGDNIRIGNCNNDTHIEYNGDFININTFIYKGCWNCPWFSLKDDEFMLVKEASAMYEVSEATIRNWCQKGLLNAKLCVKGRHSVGLFSGPNKIWLIKKKKRNEGKI